jgi:hypothetical protein
MLRGMLALLCLATITAPAQANDGGHAGGVAPVSGSHAAQAGLSGGAAGAFRGEVVDRFGAFASFLPQPIQRQGPIGFSWLKPGRSGVAVALTERFRVGLGYRLLEGEDLWPEFADTGAADYHSHHLVIRASWRF